MQTRGAPNPTQAKVAFFSTESDRSVVSIEVGNEDLLTAIHLDGRPPIEIRVVDRDRLNDTLARPDLCIVKGRPFGLISVRFGVLGIAISEVELTGKLAITPVFEVADGCAVEMVNASPQPCWHLFTIEIASRLD